VALVSSVLRACAMRRVTRGPIILLTFDPSHRVWLTDYLPELTALDETQMPTVSDYARWRCPCLSRCAYSLRQFLLLGAWQRRTGIAEAEARPRHRGMERRYADLPALDAYDAGDRLAGAG